ncbi:proteasome assembly chaperone family protein [Natrinema sp. 74]|uniref:proteasome assembly chaperone family protein n=1 Tax=Natrinema sp. 74 TaxID=3384159 RepID=UPI0038D4A701
MNQKPAFRVSMPDKSPNSTLLIGVSTIGLSSLTAVDYLVKQHDSDPIGHITTTNLPDITPFEEGKPRLPLRLYNLPDFELTVLVGEMFIPVWAADPFVNAIVEWASSSEIEEITFLHGVPFSHGPDEHDVFYVASSSYRDRLTDTELKPLTGGYLDGVAGELMTRTLTQSAPPVGTLVTPTHPPGPDFDAALRFLEALEENHGLTIEETELQERAQEVQQYYDELATRMEQLHGGEQSLQNRDFPEDRMFM